MMPGCAACTGAAAMDRRRFLAAAVAVGAVSLLGGCTREGGDGDEPNIVSPPGRGANVTVTLAAHPALAAVGGVARVSDAPPIALARTGPSEFSAFSLYCTHAGSVVAIRADNSLRCPNHGAEFAFDGAWTGGGQVTTRLEPLRTTYDPGAGTVRITT